jgi:hypothetical protein
MQEIDLSWAHPSLAKRAEKIFEHIRRDKLGRMNVTDMKLRFQSHGTRMIGAIERVNGGEWAFLSENWQTVLKDWAMCAGMWPYCPKEDPKWAKMRTKNKPKRRKKLCWL